jgi:hypothetical protein
MIPVHLWTNGGDRALMVRFVDANDKSYGGYQWPTAPGVEVTAPDWNPAAVCGGGFHGWPWGIGIGSGKEPVFIDTHWQVVSYDPKDAVWVENEKVKIRSGRVEYVGLWWKALEIIETGRTAWIQQAVVAAGASATGLSGAASATGLSGAASATGPRGAASATGPSGAASATGPRGAASATGWRGAASATGPRGAASATGLSGAASATGLSGAASATGWRGIAASTGECSTVECGPSGIAASTADEVTWVVHEGAIFIHRWTGRGGGCKRATMKRLKAVDGERITFNCGKITSRVKPAESA